MKKSTKGALAAGAAAAILLGGAGTLAYWTATDDVDAGDIASGSITLTDVVCDTDWREGTAPVALIVPGDTVTKECTGTLTLVGDHIGATIALDTASVAAAEAAFNDEVVITAEMTAPAATVTAAGVYDVTVDITVVFDGPGATNDSQGDTGDLDGLELVATQTHDTAPTV